MEWIGDKIKKNSIQLDKNWEKYEISFNETTFYVCIGNCCS